MVNILKHRKINKNPFVKFLKDFNKKDLETEETLLIDEGNRKGCLNLNGQSIITLGNGRAVYIKEDSLFLINLVLLIFLTFKLYAFIILFRPNSLSGSKSILTLVIESGLGTFFSFNVSSNNIIF